MAQLFSDTSAKLDIVIEQGETYEVDFSLNKNSSDYDLTGATITASIRPQLDSGTITEFDVEYLNRSTGSWRLKMETSKTTPLQSGGYFWDCVLEIPRTSEEPQVIRLLEGKCTVKGAVTKV